MHALHQIKICALAQYCSHISFIYLFMRDTQREREAETQAEGEAGSMHREPDVGFDPGSLGSRPGPKAGAKPLRHPGIPHTELFNSFLVELIHVAKLSG